MNNSSDLLIKLGTVAIFIGLVALVLRTIALLGKLFAWLIFHWYGWIILGAILIGFGSWLKSRR